VLLSSQFQGFCRDLHSESATLLAESVRPVALRSVLRAQLLSGRRLDRGNANPANIESDDSRLGLLSTVRQWRRACDGLARSFDRALERYLRSVLGTAPW
jgi:hypothetical protein